MKILRIAGLLGILLTVAAGSVHSARATAPITCWKYCDTHFYSGQCWATLAQCCDFNHNCPDPWEYVEGDCTDGQGNYCP
jgi:hypothetical protein